MLKRGLFLDRDGVINKDKNYLYKIEDFEFNPDIFELCRFFERKGFLIIVITNQSGIARKKYTLNEFLILTNWMKEKFKEQQANISKVYFCPHHPDYTGTCECRKPNPKMILDAKKEFNIDLANSILVGDKFSDIQAGINAGINNNFLLSKYNNINHNLSKLKVIKCLKDLILKF